MKGAKEFQIELLEIQILSENNVTIYMTLLAVTMAVLVYIAQITLANQIDALLGLIEMIALIVVIRFIAVLYGRNKKIAENRIQKLKREIQEKN